MRGSSGFTHWFGFSRPGMQAREGTRGGAIRGTHIANREGQRVVRSSASLTCERLRAERRGSGGKPASWSSVQYPVGERQSACCISPPKRQRSNRGAHAAVGIRVFSSAGRAIACRVMGRRFKSGNTPQDETQRRAPARAKSGLRPEPSGNPAGRKPQAEGPRRNIARLGSPHSEPARLTVREPPNKRAARVNRHTPKKAVMAAYVGAGFGRAAVDRRATATPRRVAGTPAKGRPGNGVVSTVSKFIAGAPRRHGPGLSARSPRERRFASPRACQPVFTPWPSG